MLRLSDEHPPDVRRHELRRYHMKDLPGHYVELRKRFQGFMEAVDNLGKAASASGPLDEKTSHLIQLAAAAAMKSEGAVHSHTRRALKAGAKTEDIYHAIILLTSTIGFPAVSAALSWIDDVMRKQKH
jgi:4-carboxymuconolactone decarboxylase